MVKAARSKTGSSNTNTPKGTPPPPETLAGTMEDPALIEPTRPELPPTEPSFSTTPATEVTTTTTANVSPTDLMTFVTAVVKNQQIQQEYHQQQRDFNQQMLERVTSKLTVDFELQKERRQHLGCDLLQFDGSKRDRKTLDAFFLCHHDFLKEFPAT
ncbi:hypothetical protein HDV00_010624 [Rhizophlyctis rosea]|nr:hypothetical protein HDV00_010624 [Rhizophlyctis rosea]